MILINLALKGADYERIRSRFRRDTESQESLDRRRAIAKTASTKAYRSRQPEERFRERLWYMYKMTVEQFEALKAQQNYRCKICNEQEPLVIDHCHRTGYVRALLCNRCNQGLGLFRESPEWLGAAAGYTRLHQKIRKGLPVINTAAKKKRKPWRRRGKKRAVAV